MRELRYVACKNARMFESHLARAAAGIAARVRASRLSMITARHLISQLEPLRDALLQTTNDVRPRIPPRRQRRTRHHPCAAVRSGRPWADAALHRRGRLPGQPSRPTPPAGLIATGFATLTLTAFNGPSQRRVLRLSACRAERRGDRVDQVIPDRVGGGGARGSRTPDLLNAIQALSQLSYGPGFGRTRAPGSRPYRTGAHQGRPQCG